MLRQSPSIVSRWITGFFMLALCQVSSVDAADGLQHASNSASLRRAIVKIYTVNSEPYYFNPWMTMPASNANGSGCIITGNRILTNAHVVANNTFIEVRKEGDSAKYQADVLHVSHEADLALLTVRDKKFFSHVTPLEIGKLPPTQEDVTLFGFPGAETLTVSPGVLTRFEHRQYKHSSNFFLTGEILADIRPGSSGGPVIADGKLVGVIMQAAPKEQIGHMVPSSVLQHFLADIDDGHYDGFPHLGLVLQSMENPSMKEKYGLPEGLTGLLINHVLPDSPAEGMLKEDDIVLAVDGHLLEDNGSVEFRPGERTYFTHFIETRQLGESVSIDVFRDGQIRTYRLRLDRTTADFALVPEQHDQKPRYFIFGGIIFSPLTKNFINAWEDAPEELLVELTNWPTRERREVVLALQVLPAEINKGYHDLNSWKIDEVNGRRFSDFQEFYRLVTAATGPYVILKNSQGYQIVIDRDKAEKSHDDILRTYNIKEDRSPDLISLHAGDYGPAQKYQ